MQRLLAAKQPPFDDETAALRCQVAALGGVEAVTSDISKMQKVRCAARQIVQMCRVCLRHSLSSSCVTDHQLVLAKLLHYVDSCNCDVITQATLILTPAVLQVTHAMGLSDQLLMAELHQTRADADHGPHKLIAHPVMRTMWHEFFSAERVDWATFWAAFPDRLPHDVRRGVVSVLQSEETRNALTAVILRHRSVYTQNRVTLLR